MNTKRKLVYVDEVLAKAEYETEGMDGHSYLTFVPLVDWLLSKVPAADIRTQEQWMPCDERMPNENGWYQCSCYDPNFWSGDGIVRNLYWNSGFGEFIDNIRFEANDFKDRDRFYWTKYVVAWMPLPKPYRKECDNNETY